MCFCMFLLSSFARSVDAVARLMACSPHWGLVGTSDGLVKLSPHVGRVPDSVIFTSREFRNWGLGELRVQGAKGVVVKSGRQHFGFIKLEEPPFKLYFRRKGRESGLHTRGLKCWKS